MCLAVPGEILSIEGEDEIFRLGKVNFGGVVKDVNLCYVPDAGIGDYILVHVGFGISIVDEKEAENLLEYLQSLGELEELKVESA